jgi:hypothetical protein
VAELGKAGGFKGLSNAFTRPNFARSCTFCEATLISLGERVLFECESIERGAHEWVGLRSRVTEVRRLGPVLHACACSDVACDGSTEKTKAADSLRGFSGRDLDRFKADRQLTQCESLPQAVFFWHPPRPEGRRFLPRYA